MASSTTPLAKSNKPRLSVAATSTASNGHDAEMLPVSSELPQEHHAKVTKAAKDEGRSLAGQLRFIVKGWFEAQRD